MAFVVDVRSTVFLLPKKNFGKALAALKKLAKERPSELEDPAATIAAKDLVSGLAANFWKLSLDGEGDAIALELGADKLPRGAISPEAVLAALSRPVERGRVVFVSEGDPEHETVYTLGGALKSNYRNRARYVVRQEPAEPPRVAPGDRVVKMIVLVHQWGDEIEIVPRVRDAGRDVIAVIDPRPLVPGEPRAAQVTIGPDALGRAYCLVDLVGDGRDVAYAFISVDVAPREHVPLEVARVEPSYQRKSRYLLGAKDIPRALEDVRAWAATTKDAPGGAFLADVAAAPDFVSAMAAAGIIAHEQGANIKRLEPRLGKLPCSEWHLLKLLESFSERVRPYSGGGFGFVRAERPERVILYDVSAGFDRTVLNPSR